MTLELRMKTPQPQTYEISPTLRNKRNRGSTDNYFRVVCNTMEHFLYTEPKNHFLANDLKFSFLKCSLPSLVCIPSSSYLLYAVGPALADAVSGPNVMCIFSQFVHHGLLSGGEFDVTQVQRGRFVTAG